MTEYLKILCAFLRVGLFTFGGGYVIIPVIERELIKKRAWVSMEEVLNFYTVSQIMPGLIGVNLSIFIGTRQKGPFAGFLAALGFILPGVSLILALALFISNFMDVAPVQHAFAGIRIAVAALILDTVIKLVKGAYAEAKASGEQKVALALYVFVFKFSVFPSGLIPAFIQSPAFLVLVSGFAGFVFFRKKP